MQTDRLFALDADYSSRCTCFSSIDQVSGGGYYYGLDEGEQTEVESLKEILAVRIAVV